MKLKLDDTSLTQRLKSRSTAKTNLIWGNDNLRHFQTFCRKYWCGEYERVRKSRNIKTQVDYILESFTSYICVFQRDFENYIYAGKRRNKHAKTHSTSALSHYVRKSIDARHVHYDRNNRIILTCTQQHFQRFANRNRNRYHRRSLSI